MTGLLDAPTRSFRANGLDVMRGVCALWVLFAHLVPWSRFANNYTVPVLDPISRWGERLFQNGGETHPAVLAFIVLSGYCIHRNGIRRQRADLAPYATRRFFRIYPVYVCAMAAGVLTFWLALSVNSHVAETLSGTSSIKLECLAAKLIGLPAVYPFLGQSCSYQGNAPLCTVMVEIVLYCVYPILLLGIARRYSERALWVLIACIWTAGTLLISLAPDLRWWWHNSSVFGYLMYWWLGVAMFNDRFALALHRWGLWIIATWIALIILFQFLPLHAPITEVRKLFFALVVCCGIAKLDSIDLRFPIFSELGKSGYSLYAFHAPVCIIMLAFGLPWWITAASAICLGYLSYLLIERPSQSIGRRLLMRLAVPPANSPART